MEKKIHQEFSGEINGQQFQREEVYQSVSRMLDVLETNYGVDSNDPELTEILHDMQSDALQNNRDGNDLIWQNEQSIESLEEIKLCQMTDLIEKLEEQGIQFDQDMEINY
ncbi:hypothetical protein [Enterococcus hulanensis]|uniref:hypothetical protein n=1 Tax=Enterococcus hulanensis TaxID=2559929 RepID=UPI0010F54431|nr:hypothetical protein [Enterococcus hulanensis]